MPAHRKTGRLLWRWTEESFGGCDPDIQKCQPNYWVWLTIRDDAVHRVLWSDGLDCRDSLVIGFRGSLEIHSVIEEENGALLSFWSLWGIIDRSRRHRAKEVLDEELEAPRTTVRDDEECDQEDHDMTEPQMSIDSSTEVSLKKKSAWADPGCEKIWCPRRAS